MDGNFRFTYFYKIEDPELDALSSQYHLLEHNQGVTVWHLDHVLNYLHFLYEEALLNNSATVQINQYVFDFVIDIQEGLDSICKELAAEWNYNV